MHISEAGFLIFLSPQMPALRGGFNVKWLGFIVLQENKTVRAFSKVSWSCQKDTEDRKKKKWRLKSGLTCVKQRISRKAISIKT